MIAIEKGNIVIRVNKEELNYYLNLGYKKVGEKEVEESDSPAKYSKLKKEMEKVEQELKTAKEEIENKKSQIEDLSVEKENLEQELKTAKEEIENLEKQLEEFLKKGSK